MRALGPTAKKGSNRVAPTHGNERLYKETLVVLGAYKTVYKHLTDLSIV